MLNLSIGLASFIVPLTATLIITPPEVAYFSAAFMLSATLLIIPYLLALSLFAERSGDPGLLHRHVRHTLPVGLALSAAIVLVVEIAAPYALRLFGPAYTTNGTAALRILILVGPAYVIKDHYVSIPTPRVGFPMRPKSWGWEQWRRWQGPHWEACSGGSPAYAPDGPSRRHARPFSCFPPSFGSFARRPSLPTPALRSNERRTGSVRRAANEQLLVQRFDAPNDD